MKLKLLAFTCFNVFASKVYELTPKYVENYKFPKERIITVPTSYARTNLELKSLKNKLSKVNVVGVEMLYSDFKRSDSFNQSALNKFRYDQLVGHFPQLKDVSWNLVAQKADNYQKAKKLFHGFVIHYRKVPTRETIEREIAEIKRMMSGEMFSSIEVESRPGGKKKYHFEGELSEDDLEDVLLTEIPVTLALTKGGLAKTDSMLFKIFKRNNHWKNKQIVCDVTGSMSPYTSQLMLWLKLNENRKDVKEVTFFNDGDNMPDHKKVIGKVGGIYSESEIEFDKISSTLFKAMINGYGGDGPENNIEASLEVLKNN